MWSSNGWTRNSRVHIDNAGNRTKSSSFRWDTPNFAGGTGPSIEGLGAGKSAYGSPNTHVESGGTATNKGSLLAGLRHGAKKRHDTGTADGNRAAGDLAKAGLMEQEAELGRAVEGKNAEMQQQQENARQESFARARQASTQQLQNGIRHANNQNSIATALRQHDSDMYWNRRNFLADLIQ